MKTMKFLARRVSALVLVATVGLTALVPAAFAAPASLPDLPKDQCVVDDANVLSSSTVQTIQDLNTQLDASCKGAQIGVLTVDYTGSVSTEDYAVEAANTWGLGSSSENNGVLILLVMQSPEYADGDYYLTYGDGFRNTTLASQASAIAQTMEDDFASQNYDGAVTTCAQNVANTIADIYGVSLSGSTTSNVAGGNYNYTDNYYEAPGGKARFFGDEHGFCIVMAESGNLIVVIAQVCAGTNLRHGGHLSFIQKLYQNFFIQSRKKDKGDPNMIDVRAHLARKPLLFDGGMGTYYKAKPEKWEMPCALRSTQPRVMFS